MNEDEHGEWAVRRRKKGRNGNELKVQLIQMPTLKACPANHCQISHLMPLERDKYGEKLAIFVLQRTMSLILIK